MGFWKDILVHTTSPCLESPPALLLWWALQKRAWPILWVSEFTSWVYLRAVDPVCQEYTSASLLLTAWVSAIHSPKFCLLGVQMVKGQWRFNQSLECNLGYEKKQNKTKPTRPWTYCPLTWKAEDQRRMWQKLFLTIKGASGGIGMDQLSQSLRDCLTCLICLPEICVSQEDSLMTEHIIHLVLLVGLAFQMFKTMAMVNSI